MERSPRLAAAPRGYAQISDLVRARIARGELKPGDRLPAVRDFAERLGVNVNTVARAYADLAREGVVVGHAGAGTRVAQPADDDLFREAREARLNALIGSAVLEALGLGFRPGQIEAAVITQIGRWSAAVPQDTRVLLPAATEVIFAGSHDLIVDLLAARLRRYDPPIHLETRYTGSLEGLVALSRDEAHLAGCHLLDEQSGEYNLPFVSRLLPGRPITLVTLANREQGLMTRPSDRERFGSVAALVEPGVRVAARQRGSGTQVLLEHLLREQSIEPGAVAFAAPPYATHLAAAASVADGTADVGLGVRAAADACRLAFTPIARERFELAIPEQRLQEPGVAAVLETLRSEEFSRTVHDLGGYDLSEIGQSRNVC